MIGCRCKRREAFSRALLISRETWPYHRFRSKHSVLRASLKGTYALRFCIVNNASDHSGEVIPVPIPNTEVKLSYVDDTGFVPGK